jgi:hypothetical protein
MLSASSSSSKATAPIVLLILSATIAPTTITSQTLSVHGRSSRCLSLAAAALGLEPAERHNLDVADSACVVDEAERTDPPQRQEVGPRCLLLRRPSNREARAVAPPLLA